MRVSGMSTPDRAPASQRGGHPREANDSNVITHRAMASTCHTRTVGPDHIIERLKAIRDAKMRVLALCEALSEGDSTAWVEVLASIMTRAHVMNDADASEALECITHAAAEV